MQRKEDRFPGSRVKTLFFNPRSSGWFPFHHLCVCRYVTLRNDELHKQSPSRCGRIFHIQIRVRSASIAEADSFSVCDYQSQPKKPLHQGVLCCSQKGRGLSLRTKQTPPAELHSPAGFNSLKGRTVRSQTQSCTSRIQTDSEENQF